MPSLFSRRRGSSQPPPMRASTTSSAAAAASQAYMQKNGSSATLSSAAAAAALRSLTSSPEPVGSIQTKRMMRRGSVSSVGGASITSARGPPLTRRDSQGSMSERTFRSPSPGRNNSMRLSSLSNAPPVPAVPRSISTRHQRASSLDRPTRALSPQNNNIGRTMSMDSKTTPLSLRAPKATRLSNVSELEEQSERLDSRNSVNFSRPMSPPVSPITAHPEGKSKYTHGAGGWFSGATGAATVPKKTASRPTVANGIEANSGKKMIPVDTHNPPAAQPPPVQYETYMAFDPHTRTFVPKQRVAQNYVQPPSPQLPTAPPLAPGSWDPHTRSIVPTSTPGGQESQTVLPSQQVMQPPPRNPKRLSMESLPQSPYLRNDADKILGDDRNAEAVLLDPGEKAETSIGSANLGTSFAHQRHVSLDVPRQSIETVDKRRQASVSPHRTRFSPSPVSDSIRHKPPPRSMSPVKSAMKPSPASSLRATSPLPAATNLSKIPSNDASDAASLASRDGTPKPKKSVRVSFDERAQEVSIPETSLEERLAALDHHDIDTEIMAPRPALPSFGSVRNQRGASPSTSATPPPAGNQNELSRDQTPGVVESTPTAQNVTQPGTAVASKTVNTPGMEATIASEHQHDNNIYESGAEIKSRDFAQTVDQSPEDKDLPNINLLPPTPGIDEESKKLGENITVDEPTNNINRNSMEGIVVPGGWGMADKTKTGSTSTESQNAPENAVSFDETPDHRSVGLLDAIIEDTDDEFSDAAEDLTEDEGGFASLNAIANSPVVIPKDSGKEAVSVPNSPTVDRTSKSIESSQAVGGANVQNWEATTSYWSRLSQTQREQMEKERLSIDDGEATPTRSTFNTIIKSDQPVLKPILKNTTPTPVSLAPIDEPRAMRRSMRDTPELRAASPSSAGDGEVRLRRSMREGVNGTALSARPAATAQRPASVLSNSSTGGRQDALSRPALMAAANGSFSSKMEQKYANDSDSESSFRKKKRASSTVDTQGRYNMKRSMRAAAGNPDTLDQQRPLSPEVPRKKERALSVRSLSPSGSFFGGRAKSEKIRESLRGNTDNGTKRTTLRGNAPAGRPASIASTGQSRFRSRFADSDDSDDDRATTGRGFFRSRFADSDDDEPSSPKLLRADLTPVRGIPKPAGQYDGDSTDLEEEAQEAPRRKPSKARDKMKTPLVPESADIEKAMEAARIKLGIAKPTETIPSGEGQALQKGSLRRDSIASADARVQTPTRFSSVEPVEEKKKRGFMGILRRNRSSTQSVPQVGSGAMDDAPPVPPLPNGVQPAPIVGNASPKSKTRPIRRLQRGDSTFSTATAPAYMSAAGNDLSDSWPLPSNDRFINGEALQNGDRPNTSDGGVSQAGRSGKSVRIAGLDEDESGIKGTRDVYSRRTGRKKKFGMLRRAFGLND